LNTENPPKSFISFGKKKKFSSEIKAASEYQPWFAN
jgi:hypothetical protein